MSLTLKHAHKRDSNIQFDPVNHKYSICNNSDFSSVTGIIAQMFPKFDPDTVIRKMMQGKKWRASKYYGMSPEEIKSGWLLHGKVASDQGTNMHEKLEIYLNDKESFLKVSANATFLESQEFKMFQQFECDFPNLQPYRTEMMIYTEEAKIAGSIDLLYEDITSPGTFVMYDFKRALKIEKSNYFEKGIHPLVSDLPSCNFYKYSLQLSIYSYILENFYDMKISEMYLLVLHPNQNVYIREKCADLRHIASEIVRLRIKGEWENSFVEKSTFNIKRIKF